MRDYLELGPTPYEENSTQVSQTKDYIPAMRAECARYAAGLEQHFQPVLDAHPGVRFSVRPNHHEFGTYYEVYVSAMENDEEGCEACEFIEENLPSTWTELETTVCDYSPTPSEAELSAA